MILVVYAIPHCVVSFLVGMGPLIPEYYLMLKSDKKVKGKAILVTCRWGTKACETSKLPHFLDNRLTDGGKVVSHTRRPPFTPQEDSWYSFLLDAESTPGP
jgi:hypothetical protein